MNSPKYMNDCNQNCFCKIKQNLIMNCVVQISKTGEVVSFEMKHSDLIVDLKKRIEAKVNIPAQQQIIVFQDKARKDTDQISTWKCDCIQFDLKQRMDMKFDLVFKLQKVQDETINKKSFKHATVSSSQILHCFMEAISLVKSISSGNTFASHLLDPQVGDCSCQIRAMLLMDIISHLNLDTLQNEENLVSTLICNCDALYCYLEAEFHKKGSRRIAASFKNNSFFVNHPEYRVHYCGGKRDTIPQSTQKAIAFVALCYICSVYQNKTNQDKRLIAKWSVEYIMSLCQKYSFMQVETVKQLVKKVQGLKMIPCFVSGSLIWKHCFSTGFKLFIEVARFPRVKFESNEFVCYTYKLVVDPSKRCVKIVSEFPNELHIHVEAISAPYFSMDKMRHIEALWTKSSDAQYRDEDYENWLQADLTFDLFEDIYHSFFAIHPQYVEGEDEEAVITKLQELEIAPKTFEYYKNLKGSCLKDATLILFRHMAIKR